MQQLPPNPMKSPAFFPPTPAASISTEDIQKILEENKRLILAVMENENLGRVAEAAQLRNQLQNNLWYLTAIADTQPQPPTTPSQSSSLMSSMQEENRNQQPHLIGFQQQQQQQQVQQSNGLPPPRSPFERDQQHLMLLQQQQQHYQTGGLGQQLNANSGGTHQPMQPPGFGIFGSPPAEARGNKLDNANSGGGGMMQPAGFGIFGSPPPTETQGKRLEFLEAVFGMNQKKSASGHNNSVGDRDFHF